MKTSAVIIGGGFYGVNIALHLSKNKNFKKIIIIEKEKSLLKRASYNNQARVHNGYHYPRSFITAYRSRINAPRFINEWPEAVKSDFTKIYAIAKNNSKVTSGQFLNFCRQIGAKVENGKKFDFLFNSRLVDMVFLVEEFTFDAFKLAEWSREQLKLAKVEVIYDAKVLRVKKIQDDELQVNFLFNKENHIIKTNKVFNCTYSGLNQIGGDFNGTHTKLKHEITEIGLFQMPIELKNFGITIMDGPFFSILPFPSGNYHTVSHVRYTPHKNWLDRKSINPYDELLRYIKSPRIDRMTRDIRRYMPAIDRAVYKDSLFEIKTILDKNEIDDGRPILYEEYSDLPGFYCILGGKMDNIFDILEKISL